MQHRSPTAQNPDVTIEQWMPEMLCWHEYEYELVLPGERRIKEVFKPDAFVRLKTRVNQYANFFIEVDLGHTSFIQFLGTLRTHQRT